MSAENSESLYDIREITEADSSKILRMILEMADESDNFPFTSEDYGMSLESQRSFINYMHQMDNCIYYGAFVGEDPIGIIYLEGGHRRKTFHLCNLGMGIKKNYWGKGIGRALMDKAIAFAEKSEYIAKIDLQVRTDNQYAIRLYRSAGFQVEGRNRRALFMNGEFYDYLSMGREID